MSTPPKGNKIPKVTLKPLASPVDLMKNTVNQGKPPLVLKASESVPLLNKRLSANRQLTTLNPTNNVSDNGSSIIKQVIGNNALANSNSFKQLEAAYKTQQVDYNNIPVP